MLLKESKSRVVAFHAIIGTLLFCVPLYLLYIVTADVNYAELLKDKILIFFTLSCGWGLARYQYIHADIEINSKSIIGPNVQTVLYWDNPQVEIKLNELAADAITQQHFIYRLLGIYIIKSSTDTSILVIAPFYEKDMLVNLRAQISSKKDITA